MAPINIIIIPLADLMQMGLLFKYKVEKRCQQQQQQQQQQHRHPFFFFIRTLKTPLLKSVEKKLRKFLAKKIC